jgi:hypothetical protein
MDRAESRIVDDDFKDFMNQIYQMRLQSTTIGFTDKTQLEKDFLPEYKKLLEGDNPTVTEYGSGVPILSLYLAHTGKIGKIFAIENDVSVLSELEYILEETKLDVEIIREDISRITELPDTDIGISINCLYGYAPTFIQGATQVPVDMLPVIGAEESYNLIKRSKHKNFGIFRAMNNDMAWKEKETAEKQMSELFETTEKRSTTKSYISRGYYRAMNLERTMPMAAGIHTIISIIRK